ncbi:tail fiber assembly protein [Escherichia coli]|uniref:tail fiber assembly protein n=1 Tax=Enterobacteriaceae TaxID=543 RepID=UPI001E5E9C73|nr:MULTISPECIES: tail fiber assembly protein [Enterobacteriaceae]EIH1079767.1 tail fiber assembly protein [Escherichia coli O163:H38]MCD1393268.1 tail fiber assembly protein [Enterobacter cloacae]MCS0905972.1 tail fiber assembly protein [Escherichia coli]HBN2225081.1 tail fiber assembly protein [Escherichia coli]HCJ8403581.1 tail fiber assembly protein [Escherichia coli]
MTNYKYSAKNDVFIPASFIAEYEEAGWDFSDAIDVDDDVYLEFINPPAGKVRVAGKDGLPAWEDIPPPTKEQLIEQTEAKKQSLIAEVNTETEMLRAKLALGRIKDDEKALLNAWMDYLDELEAVDVSTAPDVIWPEPPEA